MIIIDNYTLHIITHVLVAITRVEQNEDLEQNTGIRDMDTIIMEYNRIE